MEEQSLKSGCTYHCYAGRLIKTPYFLISKEILASVFVWHIITTWFLFVHHQDQQSSKKFHSYASEFDSIIRFTSLFCELWDSYGKYNISIIVKRNNPCLHRIFSIFYQKYFFFWLLVFTICVLIRRDLQEKCARNSQCSNQSECSCIANK